MICAPCKERRHGDCRGGTWCDCQHQAAPGKVPDQKKADDQEIEPGVNWLRQG